VAGRLTDADESARPGHFLNGDWDGLWWFLYMSNAVEPVSRILPAVPCFQQLMSNQLHSFVTDVSKVNSGKIRCTIFAR
jgi:hypothetical protein